MWKAKLADERDFAVMAAAPALAVTSQVIAGTPGDDDLEGTDLADSLSGGGGHDTLDGGQGGDTLSGGAGDDRLVGGKAWTAIVDDDLADHLDFDSALTIGASSFKLTHDNGITSAEIPQAVIETTDGTNRFYRIKVDEHMSLYVDLDWSEAYLGTSYGRLELYDNHHVLVDESEPDYDDNGQFLLAIVDPGTYFLKFISPDFDNNDAVRLFISLTGSALAQSLKDTLVGGTGNDTFVVDSEQDSVREAFGGGIDLVEAHSDYTLPENVENLMLWGRELTPLIFFEEVPERDGYGNGLDNLMRATGATRLFGRDGNDTMTGGSYMEGGAGNDLLSGDNYLDGGSGADTLQGSELINIFVVDDASDVVTDSGGYQNEDEVRSSISYTLIAGLGRLALVGTSAIDGTGNTENNVLSGNTSANRLEGLDGRDVLDGGGGVDTLIGGAGADSYFVDSAADVIVDQLLTGTDHSKIYSTVSLVLPDHARWLELKGDANIDGTGNALANSIIGNAGNNRLFGLEGTDILSALGGSNYLDGGSGADSMYGASGNDTYIVEDTNDRAIEYGVGGTDTVRASVSHVLFSTIENLVLTGAGNIDGNGNDLANVLTGNAGRNSLSGGKGNDTYYVQTTDDQVIELAGGGHDLVVSSASYDLSGQDIEDLVLMGSAPIQGTGNALSNSLTGNNAANVLTGGAGDDRLDGGKGVDTLVGGLGDDTFIINATGELALDRVGEGNDTVETVITYTLPTNIENLVLTGSAAASGNGNGLNNILTGNSANNILRGGLGNDTYVVQNTGDNVVEKAGEGTDLVYAGVSYTLAGRQVEALTLTGAASIDATGNSLANILTGNKAGNTLKGEAGHDRLDGGRGADILTGGSGDDVFVFLTGSGIDIVTDFARGHDQVDLNAYTHGTANLAMLSQDGTRTKIDLGGGDLIFLDNVTYNDAGLLSQIIW